MKKWLSDNHVLLAALGVILVTADLLMLTHFHPDSEYTIYRVVRAYQHQPDGKTKVYYKGGAIEIEGEWFLNLGTEYEFYREANSTVWRINPY